VFFELIISMQEPKSLLDDAYFFVGEIYLKRNNLDKALEAYKKVLRLNPYEKGEVVRKAKERIKEIKEKA
jgi:tetratricopeptide (TPR) repeat protein